MVVALLSSLHEKPISPHTVVCGEVGLAGEIRAVGQMEQRLREAERLGFKTLLLPEANLNRLDKTATAMQVVGETIQTRAANPSRTTSAKLACNSA